MRRWENLPNQPTQSVGNNADGLRVPETRHESGDRRWRRWCPCALLRCRERMQSGDRLLVIEMVPMPGEPDLDIALLDNPPQLSPMLMRRRALADLT